MSDLDEKERSRDHSRRERPSRFSESSRDRSLDRGARDRPSVRSSNCRVYVSNIPYEYRWQDLKDLFRSQVGDVQFVELFVDEHDKSKGCGVVEFSDSSCVKKCLEVMQRFEVKTRKLIVKDDSGNVRDKHGNIISSSSKGGRGRDDRDRYREDRYESHSSSHSSRAGQGSDESKWGNTYGLSPHFLESLRIDTPLCNRVFVANLEYNVDKKKLKEVFRLAGRIVRVDLQHDKDGRSRGFAVVEYDHPVEAVQAISMFHNQILNDRTLTVRMDRANETLKLPEGLKGIGMGLGPNGEPLKDVARNLPSLTGGLSQAAANVGAGILGAVPNTALPLAALTGLTSNVNALTNLGATANSSVLQAANLAGVSSLTSNLLSNGLTGDLSLANNLVNSQLVSSQSNQFPNLNTQNTNSLASLTSSTNQGYGSSQMSSSFSQNSGYNTVPTKGSSGSSYSPFGSSRGDVAYSSGGGVPSSAMMRSGSGVVGGVGGGGGGGVGGIGGGVSGAIGQKEMVYTRKVLVSNLPTSASYKMLSEKFNEFGDVQHLEERGNGSMLIVYATEWQAERAIKNLDRARIDGRRIDACFY